MKYKITNYTPRGFNEDFYSKDVHDQYKFMRSNYIFSASSLHLKLLEILKKLGGPEEIKETTWIFTITPDGLVLYGNSYFSHYYLWNKLGGWMDLDLDNKGKNKRTRLNLKEELLGDIEADLKMIRGTKYLKKHANQGYIKDLKELIEIYL